MRCSLLIATLTLVPSMGFVVPVMVRFQSNPLAMADKVEVCGFKDCKRAGGGSRLEKQITEILEERGVKMDVLNCDCQGECGYGPNILVDGKLVNRVKGREAIMEALGIQEMQLYSRAPLTFLSSDDDAFEEFEDSAGDDGEIIPDLEWRLVKAKLEEAHTKSFLKSKPRHLPYDECRKWVTAWHRWDCEEDWKEWIDMGEKRNAYIPARPDEYYGATGQWISWDHFLGKVGNEKGIDDADYRVGGFD